MKLMQLPIVSKTYVPEGMVGGNISVSYWYEASEKDGQGKGGVGLFVSLSGPDDFSGERSAKFMWDSFLEVYLYSEGTVGDVLRKSAKAARQRLVDLMQHEAGVSEQGVDVHVCAFAIVDGAMSVILMGEPGVVLVRGGKKIDLTEVVPSFSGEGLREEISVGNFSLSKADTLIISTPKLVQSFLATLEEGEGGEDATLDWTTISNALETFSQNLVGNQYVWTLGYGIEEHGIEAVKEADMVHKDVDVPQQSSDKSGGLKQEGKEEEGAPSEVKMIDKEKSHDGSGFTHTPTGIRPAESDEGQAGIGQVAEQTSNVTAAVSGMNGSNSSAAGMSMKQRGLFSRTALRSRWNTIVDRVRRGDIVKRTGRAMKAKVSSLKMGGFRSLSQKKLFVGREEGTLSRIMKSKGALLIVFVVLIVLMSLYVWRQSKERERIAEIDRRLEDVSSEIEKAELDWEAMQNRVAVEDSLMSISSILDEIEDNTLQPEQNETIDDLRDDVQYVYDLMDRVTPLTEENGSVEILTDLYLKIGEDTEPTDFEKYGSDLYFVDNAAHAVYRYSPLQDSISQVANSAEILENPQYIAISSGYLFVYDAEVGVVMLDMNVNEPEWTFKVRPELSARTIGEVTEIAAYGESGSPANIYILKKDEARVLKSYPAGAGYSFPEEYFRNGGFDKAVDILIDGNVYVYSNSSEKIYKYFIGAQDAFTLSGLSVPLGQLCCGSTNMNDTGKLYVYDVTNRRIVSLEKPTSERHPGVGVLVKQYVYRGDRDDLFNDVKEIVVDIDERVIYILDGTRVLQVSLDND